MEEIITSLGNFGSPSGYIPLFSRVMVLLGMIGDEICSLFREGRVRCSSGLCGTEAASGVGVPSVMPSLAGSCLSTGEHSPCCCCCCVDRAVGGISALTGGGS